MAQKKVVTPWGESWVDDTPAPAPAPQKFTPIDIQTPDQNKVADKFTQNLLTPKEQTAQKVQAPVTTPAPTATQQPAQAPTTVPFASNQEQVIPTKTQARQDQTNTQWVSNASVQWWQGQITKPVMQNAPQTQNAQGVKPQVQEDFYSPDNFMMTGITKDQYDALDVNGKINALWQWAEFLKTRQNVNEQANYMQKLTAQREYLQKQQGIKTESTAIQNENAQIQADQQLRASMQAFNNLEQNLWFLWSGWRPAQFKQSMESMKFMLFDAQRKHDELVKMEANGQKLRDLGIQFDANEFQKTIDNLNQQLNDNVDKTIQQALSNFNSEMMLGNIDTPAKLNALTNKYLDSVDLNVTNLTNRQLGKINGMITQYTDLAKNAQKIMEDQQKAQAEYQKWVNTVNKDMSTVKGYYVDWNWSPIIDIAWKPIPMPEEAPMEPVFKDGYLIQFTRWADWQIVATPQKIMEDSDMDKIKLMIEQENLKSKQLENAAAQWVDITWMWWATWDLRWMASQFPWQARAKNNNPAGITWNANFDNPKPWTTAYALQQAGVNYSKWTARPSWEGWNYVTFPTIEDWLKAQQIMMTQTYWNSTVDQMLRSWVGTWEWPNYAKQVAWMAWVPLNVKVSQLTPEQLSTLQNAKIKKESPWLFKLLNQQPKQPSAPTPSELAMFEKWAQYIGAKWWLTKQRFDEISAYQSSQEWDILNTYEPTFKNESQTKSFEYANRMIPAKSILDSLESTWLNDNVWRKLNFNKRAPDFLESSEYQQYDQAKRDFINATLRKESWATISDSEFANAEKQYFIQPWDKKEVIAQKKANREQALKWFMQTSWPWNWKYLEAVKKQYEWQKVQAPTQPTWPAQPTQQTLSWKSTDDILKEMLNK